MHPVHFALDLEEAEELRAMMEGSGSTTHITSHPRLLLVFPRIPSSELLTGIDDPNAIAQVEYIHAGNMSVIPSPWSDPVGTCSAEFHQRTRNVACREQRSCNS
jgi:hypothetical protein